MDLTDRMRGCLLGLAVGDAVGTTVEFARRGTFEPVTDMTGGGPFGLAPGEWTDDTSMALCLAESLVECGGFDARDQIERYCRWADDGYLSSNGTCFDIGATVAAALDRYRRTGEPFSGSTDERSAGNGSIMRLAPIPMFFHPDQSAALHYAVESSRTTHGAVECLDACRVLAAVVTRALDGASNGEVLDVAARADTGLRLQSERVTAVAQGVHTDKPESAIRGSGYVVKSLEAALWAFRRTNCFEEAILSAVNLGDDADTTAAVCGQMAGAHYGASGIPIRWRERLALSEKIETLADRLAASGPSEAPARRS